MLCYFPPSQLNHPTPISILWTRESGEILRAIYWILLIAGAVFLKYYSGMVVGTSHTPRPDVPGDVDEARRVVAEYGLVVEGTHAS